jgi:hypothetical protein
VARTAHARPVRVERHLRLYGGSARLQVGLLVAVGCTALLAAFPIAAQAQQSRLSTTSPASAGLVGRGYAPRSAASTFCGHISLSQVSKDVNNTLSLNEAVLEKTTLECIYFGKVVASSSHPITEVVISMEPNIPKDQISTRSEAEARLSAESRKGVKLVLTTQSSVSSTAFTWTYSKSLNGGQLAGIASAKGTTGYGVAFGGAASTFGAASKYLSDLEHVLSLDIAA